MRARHVMTQGVVTVSPDDPLEKARARLTENRFSALPVVDRGYRLVGIVTTFDVLRAEVRGHADAAVSEVMTREPMTMGPDSPVTILSHRLRRYGERRVMPIVERGVLVGVVTRGDLLKTPPRRSFFDRLLGSEPDDPDDLPADRGRFGTTAGEVMTPFADLIYAETDTPVAAAAAALSTHRFTALPVLDGEGVLRGIVSEADLVTDNLSGRRGPTPARCGDAMTSPATAVRHDVPLAKVARTMIEHRRRVFPVVDDAGRLVGMISRGDLLRADSPPEEPAGPEEPEKPA
ncbi:HPP family protein [Actinomycetospora sp. TBRC 11914]|uniref:CBS domain-containing protein n=1 Tax=Actinomycetospora sp. TBRC 11914 TaxID=2729387 RepID=UPI00145F81B3|nr:CBS domain-containing protein [Actinomycetospora sp. TBRC 11914]NMO91515.1 CBS domain-containing protein [Actinomycetospora sp. TBRC 11914]